MLHFSELKEFSGDNFEFNGNARKFSKRVENTVGKGEFARYEQFLLFPHCFQKTCTTDMSKHLYPVSDFAEILLDNKISAKSETG